MTGVATCPHCNQALELMRIKKTENYGGDYILAFVEGFCEKCGKHYSWVEKYSYEAWRDLRED